MEEFWEDIDERKDVIRENELKEAIFGQLRREAEKDQAEKIMGMMIIGSSSLRARMKEIVLPDWLITIAQEKKFDTANDKDVNDILKVVNQIFTGCIEKYGYLFLGMDEWNYLLAVYRLSHENSFYKLELYEGNEVDEWSPSPEDFWKKPETRGIEDLIPLEYRDLAQEGKTESTLEEVEQMLAVLLMRVAQERVLRALQRHVPKIVDALYDGDGFKALTDIQDLGQRSKIVQCYCSNILALSAELRMTSPTLLSDKISNVREQMDSMFVSEAACLFSGVKVEERSLATMMAKAEPKEKEIVFNALLREIELYLLEKLINPAT